MKKYGRIYKCKYGDYEYKYRYNYEDYMVECVYKPSKNLIDCILKDIEEDKNSTISWLKSDAIRNLESIEQTGYAIISRMCCSIDAWKERRDNIMDEFSEYITCECMCI